MCEGHASRASLAHKLGCSLTALAVVLGVAFMAGTLVLTDTISKTFDDLFADVYRGTDAVVRVGQTSSKSDFGDGAAAIAESASLVDGPRPSTASPPPRASITATPAGRQERQGARHPATGRRPSALSWADDPDAQPVPRSSRAAPRQADDEVVIDQERDGRQASRSATRIDRADQRPAAAGSRSSASPSSAPPTAPAARRSSLLHRDTRRSCIADPASSTAITVVADSGVSPGRRLAPASRRCVPPDTSR